MLLGIGIGNNIMSVWWHRLCMCPVMCTWTRSSLPKVWLVCPSESLGRSGMGETMDWGPVGVAMLLQQGDMVGSPIWPFLGAFERYVWWEELGDRVDEVMSDDSSLKQIKRYQKRKYRPTVMY